MLEGFFCTKTDVGGGLPSAVWEWESWDGFFYIESRVDPTSVIQWGIVLSLTSCWSLRKRKQWRVSGIMSLWSSCPSLRMMDLPTYPPRLEIRNTEFIFRQKGALFRPFTYESIQQKGREKEKYCFKTTHSAILWLTDIVLLPQPDYLFTPVHLWVGYCFGLCVFLSRISQKLLIGFPGNLREELGHRSRITFLLHFHQFPGEYCFDLNKKKQFGADPNKIPDLTDLNVV